MVQLNPIERTRSKYSSYKPSAKDPTRVDTGAQQALPNKGVEQQAVRGNIQDRRSV